MEVKDAFEELEGKSVSLAGRMMSKRVMGKALFAVFRTYRVLFSLMLQEIISAKTIIKISRKWISVIL